MSERPTSSAASAAQTPHFPGALSRRPDYQSDARECLPDAVILGAITHVLYAVSEVRPTVDAVTVVQATAPADEEYQRISASVRAGSRSDFVFQDDLLHFHGKPSGSTPRLYIPAGPFRAQLVAEAHDIAISGHLGRTKTLERLSRAFYWPNMHRVVAEYVRTCPSCQVNKPSNQKPLGLLYSLPVPQRRWESVSLDLVTGLPMTAAGHDTIVVFVDRLTKMIRIVPTQQTVTAEGTARLFFDHVFRHGHGVPSTLVSDRDPRFTSQFWQSLFKLLGTRFNMSTANHAQTDGQTERANRTIEDILRAYVGPHQDDWDQHLTAVEFAYNDSVQLSSGHTPFFLNYGQHPSTPLTLTAGRDSPASGSADVDVFVARMRDAIASARAAIAKAQQQQATQANKRRSDQQFSVGDKVYLSAGHLRAPAGDADTRKLSPKAYGPFEILQVLSPVSYKLRIPSHYRMHPVVHISALRAHVTSGAFPEREERYTPPPPQVIQDEEYFSIAAFVAERGKGATHSYLVHWEGYGPEHRLWRKASQLLQDMPRADFDAFVREFQSRKTAPAQLKRTARSQAPPPAPKTIPSPPPAPAPRPQDPRTRPRRS